MGSPLSKNPCGTYEKVPRPPTTYECEICSLVSDGKDVYPIGCECNIARGHDWCRTCMVEEMRKDPEWFFKDTQCPIEKKQKETKIA